MRKYQIKDLERLTGIKAHTIRIWEKRYNILNPERTDTNIRYYSDNDLRKLLNVTLLLQKGSKISKVSQLNDDQLNHEVQDSLNAAVEIDKELEPFLTGLCIAMVELDEKKFNQIYAKSLHQKGFEHTIVKLIYPFLAKIGIMWGVNEINPAQEHFVSNLIRQKMLAAIDNLNDQVSQTDSYVLFLPQDEHHEIGLLMAYYILKVRGYQVYYLGQNVPHVDLQAVVDYTSPSHLLTILTASRTDEQIQKIIKQNTNSFPHCKFLIAGIKGREAQLKITSTTLSISGVDDFINYLN
ncbi:MAG: helix-turn-helix-type transcriptional regulator [Crocinitomicaceae bacterium]|nr:helix-turn-helix-type transcriptional regulator [Crocinitomicaceae bacterium]